MTASGRTIDCRPVVGARGAVSAAHPAAVQAGTDTLQAGGSAVDAAVAAQAVVCVTMPHAAGLGGDLLALVRAPDGAVIAVGGAGLSPARTPPGGFGSTGGSAVTVPGLVEGWLTAHDRWGQLRLATVLAPAERLARDGVPVDADLAAAVTAQRQRLAAGGAAGWPLLDTPSGTTWRQPELADLLHAIATAGYDAFYRGTMAVAICAAAQRHGGSMAVTDLTTHRGVVGDPLSVSWAGGTAHVQPPPSQGVLLAMALSYLESRTNGAAPTDHLLVELTEAAFGYRSDCGRGNQLLTEPLTVDDEWASRQGGPRAYLHTAGVAVADAAGMVVSSLVSVFDDFGAAVFVPEAGIVLNNRAGGFTGGANSAAPSKRPVHTLAPALIEERDGSILALATPGADGQVQTLLQVLSRLRYGRADLDEALTAPRWRSESGQLLIEAGHPATADLRRRGHDVIERRPGESVFGGVVAAGHTHGRPFAAGDWRRAVSSGAV